MLFSNKQINWAKANVLFRELNKKSILAEAAQRLDEEIALKEVSSVMENLPLGKQAGPNRIPNAVYKYMSSIFAPGLTRVLNEAARDKKLPKTFLEGDISVMYKKGSN